MQRQQCLEPRSMMEEKIYFYNIISRIYWLNKRTMNIFHRCIILSIYRQLILHYIMPIKQLFTFNKFIFLLELQNKHLKQMLNQANQAQVHNPKGIKLSNFIRSQPIHRASKSNLVSSRESTASNRNNDIFQSSKLHPQFNFNNSKTALTKIDNNSSFQILQDSRSRQVLNQKQSPLRSSRQIRRSNILQESLMSQSQYKGEVKSPMVFKEESQATRTSQLMNNDSFFQTEINRYQIQISELTIKMRSLDNENNSLKRENDNLKQILEIHKQRVVAQEQIIKELQKEKEKIKKQGQKGKQNGTNLSKLLNQARLATLRKEGEIKQLSFELENERKKMMKVQKQLGQTKRMLNQFYKIRDLVKDLQQSEGDKSEIIKRHLAYEIKLIEANSVMSQNLEMHKHDLRVASQQQQNINKQIEYFTQQIASKLKGILEEKNRLEVQLKQAKEETEKIRRTMFNGYQQIISKLKDDIIALKEQNVNLASNSDSKIIITKLQRQINILQARNQQLVDRKKELEDIVERLQAKQKTCSDFSSQTSIRGGDYFDQSGQTNLKSIIMNYETHSLDLNERIFQKQQKQSELKKKMQELETEIKDLRTQAQFSSQKQKSQSENVKSKIESMKMELKSETDSLHRKIESLQCNIHRKNKEIKEKDKFITHFLIHKLKDSDQIEKIQEEMNKYFSLILAN